MSETNYIGRGELIAKKILAQFLKPVNVRVQVPIEKIILAKEFAILDPEIKKHKFDFVFFCLDRKSIVVEINYHHKEKAARKWRNVFIPLLVNAGFDFLTINDYDCRERGLFWLNSKKEHVDITWDDFRDVIDALAMAGIYPRVFEKGVDEMLGSSDKTLGGSLSHW